MIHRCIFDKTMCQIQYQNDNTMIKKKTKQTNKQKRKKETSSVKHVYDQCYVPFLEVSQSEDMQ